MKKKIIFSALLFIVSSLSFLIGIMITESSYEKEINNLKSIISKQKNEINELKLKNSELNLQLTLKKTHKTELNSLASEILDYKLASKNYHPKEEKISNIKEKNLTSKPQLVIIIDDMAFKWEVNLLKKIPYHITPSFFPPTSRHPDTDIFAQQFTSYMVHTPMQAIHYPKPEENTLEINDSYQTIYNKLRTIKDEFPRAYFINNHTGSSFTSDSTAMIKLFKAMKELNISFIDSRTTPYSKSGKVDKIYPINKLYKRDIFLDNIQNREYIRKQLKKAILIAKRRGYAIAIGHPHPITLETLRNSKDLLKDVKVVYIDELNTSK